MSTIFDALLIIANGITPEIYARQKSGLAPSALSYGSATAEVEKWDKDILTNIESHIILANTELDEAAGERFSWPLDGADMLGLWPQKTTEERDKTVGDINRLAAEAVLRRVWGDLRTQADTRAGLPFSAQGKALHAQADQFMKRATAKITGPVAALDKAQEQGGTGGTAVEATTSTPVQVVAGW